MFFFDKNKFLDVFLTKIAKKVKKIKYLLKFLHKNLHFSKKYRIFAAENNHKNYNNMTLTVTKNGDVVTGFLAGRLDTAASQQFATDMEQLKAEADKHLVVDCKDLEFISSSGLRLLLALRKETMAKGGDVTIVNIKPEIKQVFTITGFVSLFKFQ